MSSKLGDLVINKNIKTVSIIGLAKNTGKTVTLNQLIEELYLKSYQIGVLSYGRDGENIDLITGKKKPPVKVYPGIYFVTAQRALKDTDLKYKKVTGTKIRSTMGYVNLYQSLSEGKVQLVGVNRLSQLILVKNLLFNKTDYILVDGALDRKSSALPKISGAMVLATGAVIGEDMEDVIEKTKYEVQKLQIPFLEDQNDIIKLQEYCNKNNSVIWTEAGQLLSFKSPTSLLLMKDVENYLQKSKVKLAVKYIFIKGAFTGTIARKLIDFNLKGITVVIPDSTKLFIDEMEYNYLTKNAIKIRVLYPINLIALTINPHNPAGKSLEEENFLLNTKKQFDIPVFNVESRDY
ncbi:MAG: hypothetical protein R6V14_00360 [Halanaerobiales bacterium]